MFLSILYELHRRTIRIHFHLLLLSSVGTYSESELTGDDTIFERVMLERGKFLTLPNLLLQLFLHIPILLFHIRDSLDCVHIIQSCHNFTSFYFIEIFSPPASCKRGLDFTQIYYNRHVFLNTTLMVRRVSGVLWPLSCLDMHEEMTGIPGLHQYTSDGANIEEEMECIT